MLKVSEALQQAEFMTNPAGQLVVQLNLAAWQTIQAAVQTVDDAIVMQLFLDFALTDALRNNTLRPYTAEMSQLAHSLVDGVEIDHE
jgi:antitoxin PrlF